MLLVAAICDAASIITTLLLPTLIGGLAAIIPCLVLDLLCLMVIGAWMFGRAGSGTAPAEGEEEEEETALPDISLIERDKTAAKTDQQAGKGAAKETEKATKAAEKEMAQAEKATAKQVERTAARKASRKVAARTAIKMTTKTSGRMALKLMRSFVGTLVPILQLFPFWTFTVVGELKGKKPNILNV